MATKTTIGSVMTWFTNNISTIKTKIGNATTSAAGLMSNTDKSKLDGIATGANKTTVDSALSTSSTNPVQNKVVAAQINSLSSSLTKTAITLSDFASGIDANNTFGFKIICGPLVVLIFSFHTTSTISAWTKLFTFSSIGDITNVTSVSSWGKPHYQGTYINIESDIPEAWGSIICIGTKI